MTVDELIERGRKARAARDLQQAVSFYCEAAEQLRSSDRLRYAHTIRHVADMFLHQDRLVEAKPLYEETLAVYRSDLNTKVLDLANAVRPYAILQERLGEVELARKLWQEARNLYQSLCIDEGARECDAHLENFEKTC